MCSFALLFHSIIPCRCIVLCSVIVSLVSEMPVFPCAPGCLSGCKIVCAFTQGWDITIVFCGILWKAVSVALVRLSRMGN
ncbi:hypothetical protein BDV59DRAFT_187817 [Aspergillus ambiguus]|uniref:uncharacterized protein n=1 Tax=Aspergillus ambiguus TaxID=176160 RepID=UPI003CCD38C6